MAESHLKALPHGSYVTDRIGRVGIVSVAPVYDQGNSFRPAHKIGTSRTVRFLDSDRHMSPYEIPRKDIVGIRALGLTQDQVQKPTDNANPRGCNQFTGKDCAVPKRPKTEEKPKTTKKKKAVEEESPFDLKRFTPRKDIDLDAELEHFHQTGEQSPVVKEIVEWLKANEGLHAFHGTYDEILADVSKHGLVPKKSLGADAIALEHGQTNFEEMEAEIGDRKGSVYLATSPDFASSFANYVANNHPGSKPVILRIEVPQSELEKGMIKYDEGVDPLQQVMTGGGFMRHVGPIKPGWIKDVLPAMKKAPVIGNEASMVFYICFYVTPKEPTDNANPKGCNQHTGPGCAESRLSPQAQWTRPAAGKPSKTVYDDMTLPELISKRTTLGGDLKQLGWAGWTDEFQTKEAEGLTAEIARSNWRTNRLELNKVEAAFEYKRRNHDTSKKPRHLTQTEDEFDGEAEHRSWQPKVGDNVQSVVTGGLGIVKKIKDNQVWTEWSGKDGEWSGGYGWRGVSGLCQPGQRITTGVITLHLTGPDGKTATRYQAAWKTEDGGRVRGGSLRTTPEKAQAEANKAVQHPLIVNTWSEAARQAAIEARRAKTKGKQSKGGKKKDKAPKEDDMSTDVPQVFHDALFNLESLPKDLYKTVKDGAVRFKKWTDDRYGKGWTKAIAVAALAGTPVPVPGSSFLAAAPILALAEIHRMLAGGPLGNAAKDSDEKDMSPKEIVAAAKELLKELRREFWGKGTPYERTYEDSGDALSGDESASTEGDAESRDSDRDGEGDPDSGEPGGEEPSGGDDEPGPGEDGEHPDGDSGKAKTEKGVVPQREAGEDWTW